MNWDILNKIHVWNIEYFRLIESVDFHSVSFNINKRPLKLSDEQTISVRTQADLVRKRDSLYDNVADDLSVGWQEHNTEI